MSDLLRMTDRVRAPRKEACMTISEELLEELLVNVERPKHLLARQQRQVLAVGDERAEEPGAAGHPYRGRRRADGFS